MPNKGACCIEVGGAHKIGSRDMRHIVERDPRDTAEDYLIELHGYLNWCQAIN
jgi:hypothetical protein